MRPRRRRRPAIATALRSSDPVLLCWAASQKLFTLWQLQRRFPRVLTSTRTAYRAIERLYARQLINIAPIRQADRTWPDVFYVTGRGVRHLRDEWERSGRVVPEDLQSHHHRRHGAVVMTALHDLAVTEFSLALEQTVRQRLDLQLRSGGARLGHPIPKVSFRRDEQTRAIVPDAAYMTASDLGERGAALQLTCLEVDLSTESNPVVLDKLLRYDWAAKSSPGRQALAKAYRQHGPDYRHHAWRIAVVVHDPLTEQADERRLASFVTQALWLPAASRNRLWLTTAEQLQRHVSDSQPLGHAIWIKLYDCRSWLHQFRDYAHQPHSRPQQRQRQFVEAKLVTLPRHYFFGPVAVRTRSSVHDNAR